MYLINLNFRLLNLNGELHGPLLFKKYVTQVNKIKISVRTI